MCFVAWTGLREAQRRHSTNTQRRGMIREAFWRWGRGAEGGQVSKQVAEAALSL